MVSNQRSCERQENAGSGLLVYIKNGITCIRSSNSMSRKSGL